MAESSIWERTDDIKNCKQFLNHFDGQGGRKPRSAGAPLLRSEQSRTKYEPISIYILVLLISLIMSSDVHVLYISIPLSRLRATVFGPFVLRLLSRPSGLANGQLLQCQSPGMGCLY